MAGWRDAPIVGGAAWEAAPLAQPRLTPNQRRAQQGLPPVTAASLKASNPAEYDPQSQQFQAATAQPGFMRGLGRSASNMLLGAPEVLLSGVTGGLGTLADVATLADPGSHDWMYQPRSGVGQAAQEQIATVANPLLSAIGSGYDKVAGTGPLAQTLKERGAQAAEAIGMVAGAGSIPKAMSSAVRPRASLPKHPAVVKAKELGFKLDPNQVVGGQKVGSAVDRGVSRMGGKHDLPAELSLDNQKTVAKLVREEIGIPEGEHITPATIDRLRGDANQKYAALERVGVDIQPDVNFFHNLHKVVMDSRSELRGGAPDPRVSRLVDQYRKTKDKVSVGETMEEVRRLRFDARKNQGAESPSTVRLGNAQRQVADALEDLIDRQVSEAAPDAVGEWRAARQQLAKLHTLEDAMDGSEINPQAFAKALERGEPLSGRFRDIAEVAQNFPHVMRSGSRLGTTAGFGLLDLAMTPVTAGVWPAARYGAKKYTAWQPRPKKGPGIGVRRPEGVAGLGAQVSDPGDEK